MKWNNTIKSRRFRIIPSQKYDLIIQKLSQTFKPYKTKTAWGLDIGGHALKAVKIKRTPGELSIEDIDVIDYPAIPADVNFLQTPCIKDAIQTLLTKHSIAKTDNVLVSLPGQFVLSRFPTVPPVSRKQLKDIVRYEAKQQIPFDLKDIVWDYQQLTEKVPGVEVVEVGLFASKRATLDHILTGISYLKPQLTAFPVSPLAIYNFILFDQQVDGPTVILNIETENTDLIIADSLHLWLRNIPFSTVDADLVKEIQRSIEYYKSLTKETVHFKTLVLMGNRFKDPLNVKFMADNFAYEIKALKTSHKLKLSSKIDPTYLNENVVNLGVALGLALQGIGLGRTKINLLPPELIKAAEISKKRPYAIATLGCLAMSLAIQYGGLHIRINQLHNSDDYHQKVLQNIRELERKYKNAETLVQTNRTALELVSSIDSSRFFWIEALDKLLSLIPDNVSITSIQSSWIDTDTIKPKDTTKQISPGFSQAKKATIQEKPGTSKKTLTMGIKGESREPSISFIEESVLKPIREVTLFDHKIAAFKDVQIVPGSCRQVERKNTRNGYISFEIRWIVKSQDEIQSETNALSSIPGTSTPSVKS